MRVLVIGGTLFIGRLLVKQLLKAGHEVAILHRKPSHDLGRRVENLAGDRNDAASLRQAIGHRRFDVVFDNVYDWERGTTAGHVEATLQAVSNGRLARYIFMSSVAAYGDGLNHYEGDALAPDDHPDAYVRNKAQTERMLFRLHHRTGFPVVTFRPPYVYGPENPFYREAFFWDRLHHNRPIILPGDGHRLMQFAYVKDLVDACMRAMEEPAAVGEAFNVGNEKPITQAELLQLFAKIAGKKAVVRSVPRERIVELGGNPMGDPLYFGVYFDLPPITEVVTKVKRVLKISPTPFEEGLREAYRWYLKQDRPEPDFSFEDKLLALSDGQPTK